MDFDLAPYMQNPVVFYIGLTSAVILMLKGMVVCLTELVQMIPPLIKAIKTCWKAVTNGKTTD